MTNIPSHLQDAKDLLTQDGFATSNIWYHGTSSALLTSILSEGLKCSGDKAMKQAMKKTMATIGNTYTESIEPVFLTQSRELAYYWGEQAVLRRKRFAEEEQPVVLAARLPEEINKKVRPDVGAASLLLMSEGKQYLEFLKAVAERSGVQLPEVDLMNADRMAYLTHLGMAYLDQDIPVNCLSLVEK